MSHFAEKKKFSDIVYNLYLSYIPNKKDNLKQVILKLIFILSFILLVISSSFIISHFVTAQKQDNIIDDSREKWHTVNIDTQTESQTENQNESEPISPDKEQIIKELVAQNPDFKGWITLNNTKVDNPIFQTTNNDFYLTHNQNKQKSAYGALYFDCENVITEEHTDHNLVIFGHEMKNGSMFGQLKKLRNINFFKENNTLEFSTLYDNGTYRIFSIFVLNAVKQDDNGRIFNIYFTDFDNKNLFESWKKELNERSIINTNIDITPQDDIITLVTCCNDFDNARLVVMAKKITDSEKETFDPSTVTLNKNPRYPKKWYEKRGLEYPF